MRIMNEEMTIPRIIATLQIQHFKLYSILSSFIIEKFIILLLNYGIYPTLLIHYSIFSYGVSHAKWNCGNSNISVNACIF